MLDLRSKNRSVFAASAAVIVALLLFCFSSVNISAQIKSSSAEIDLVNGLQRRRLFDLAKFHCRQILDDSRTPDRLKIDIAVADLKTRTAEATQADPDLRKQFWTETERIGEAHLQRFSASPRAILIKVQQSLVLQAKIEQLRQELQADMAAGDTKDKALSWIRQAVRSFESIDQEIGQLMTVRRRPGDSSDALTSFELRALRFVESGIQFAFKRRAVFLVGGGHDK